MAKHVTVYGQLLTYLSLRDTDRQTEIDPERVREALLTDGGDVESGLRLIASDRVMLSTVVTYPSSVVSVPAQLGADTFTAGDDTAQCYTAASTRHHG